MKRENTSKIASVVHELLLFGRFYNGVGLEAFTCH